MGIDLKSYEGQARFSVLLAGAAALAAAGAAVFMARFYSAEYGIIIQSLTSRRALVILIPLLAGAGMAAIGMILAFNGAGQKRNKQSGLSWLGFFLNAGVTTLALSLIVVFWFLMYIRG